MAIINPSIPTVGQPDATEEPKVATALQTIIAEINGGLDTANLDAAASITDSQLASPRNSLWRTIHTAAVYIGSATAAGTYAVGRGTLVATGGNVYNATTGPPSFIRFEPSEFSVSGKTTEVRITTALACNDTAPNVAITPGLYPFEQSGSAALALGTRALAGGAFGPSPYDVSASAGTAAAAPAAGVYLFGLSVPSLTTAGSVMVATFGLQVRNV